MQTRLTWRGSSGVPVRWAPYTSWGVSTLGPSRGQVGRLSRGMALLLHPVATAATAGARSSALMRGIAWGGTCAGLEVWCRVWCIVPCTTAGAGAHLLLCTAAHCARPQSCSSSDWDASGYDQSAQSPAWQARLHL